MPRTPTPLRHRLFLAAAATAATVACSDPVRPPDSGVIVAPPPRAAAAFGDVQTITLVSGNGAVGSLDAATEFSATRGAGYAAAPIVAGASVYSTIPGTHWVSNDPSSIGPVNGSMWYRTTFQLPAGCNDPSVNVAIHADNAATVYLNGVQIGAQTRAEIFPNFQDPAESYTASGASLLICGGSNVLEFELYNFQNPTALDYKAVVSYARNEQIVAFTSIMPSPGLLGGTYVASATGGASGNPVVFSSLTPAVCSVSGNVVSLDAVGSCTVAANQDGNADYAPAQQVTQTFLVVWPFGGFTSPIANPPALNGVKAGQSVPVKFSLGGDRGLAIFASGFPASSVMACDASATSSVIDETITAGGSTLSYDPTTGLYSYVWKTDKAWADSCRRLVLRFTDGWAYEAYFAFRR